jgi:hypothetical protein
MHKVRLLGLPADQEALILGKNMARLLSLPDSTAAQSVSKADNRVSA